MNYKIITDEKLLKDFIEWLPELKQDEKYYFCLFARNKYCKELTHIKSDKAQLKRFVSDKDRLFWKIKQLECEIDSYRQKEIPVPQEALALYMTVNPRSMLKATVNTMVKLAQSIRDQNINMNAHQEALSEIQKAKSRTCFVDFDVDNKDSLKEISEQLDNQFNEYHILESRGGYHVMVNPEKVKQEFKNSWYNTFKRYSDQTGDIMIPVVGTYQGGFTPKFIKNVRL